MNDGFDLVRGGDNPFRDAGIADADTELMKADLAARIVRILREKDLSGVRAAELAGVPEADISRIRKAVLDRFTIDRLVRIHNRLDQGTRIRVKFSRQPDDRQPGAMHP